MNVSAPMKPSLPIVMFAVPRNVQPHLIAVRSPIEPPPARSSESRCASDTRIDAETAFITLPGRRGTSSGLAAPARDRDLAGAGHLDETDRSQQVLQRVDLVAAPGDLDDNRALVDVDDRLAEDLAD